MNAPVGANPNGGKDWAKVRTAGGHPAPYHVKWWEVGNETHGNMTWTSGIPSDKRAKAYAFGGTSTFSNQMVGKPCNHIPANSLSDGTPSQVFAVYYPPVKPGSLTLTVDGKRWTRTNNLASAGPNEQVYEVVASTGKIIFGNDTDGAIPPKLAQIRVSYTSGPHAGYVDFYQAMKKVDPHIRVCWGTEHMDYGVLGGKYPVDCVEDHLYSGNPPARVHSDVSWHDAMMHKADVKGAKVIHHQATLKKLYPHANIVATEYGLLNSLKYTAYGKHHQTYKRGYLYSLDDGLYAGSMLIDFISAGIPLVNSENLAGGMEPYPGDPRAGAKRWRFFGLSAFGFYPHYLPQALGYVVSMFSNLMGPNQVTAKIINNPRRIPANADNKPYAVFRVVASKGNNSKYLTLIVVNRDPKRDITASIQTKQYKHRGTATVWTVNGRSVTAFNDPTHPKAVRLVKDQVQIGKGVFEYTFPAHSATAIRLVSRQ
jgi:alpha-N-arabinofuranosidase